MKSTALRFAAVTLLMAGGLRSVQGQTARPINVVTTAVPFLRISPDARAGGMGDLGIATTPMPVLLTLTWARFPLTNLKPGLT
jgi:hypothetical protein